MGTYKTVKLDGQAVSEVVTNAAAVNPGVLGNIDADGAFTVAANSDNRLFVFGDNRQDTDGCAQVAAGQGGDAYQIRPGDLRTLILAAAQTVAKNAKLDIAANGQVVVAAGATFVAYAEEAITTGAGETAQIAATMA